MEGAEGAATSGLLDAIDPTKTFDFPLLDKPSDIIQLLFGKPVTLVQINVPTLTFNFTYMQDFPIIGPLVGTFEGGIGATINLSLGYDTQGLSDFLASKNPASLIDGFFFNTHDPNDPSKLLPVATLTAEIAVGAAIDLGLIKAGVEGGITATINFSWDDLNKDGKVRLDEMKANILANGGDPLAVFDITGELDLFLKAYVTIDLFITSFTLTYDVPDDHALQVHGRLHAAVVHGHREQRRADARDRAELEEPHPGRPHRHVRDDPRQVRQLEPTTATCSCGRISSVAARTTPRSSPASRRSSRTAAPATTSST